MVRCCVTNCISGTFKDDRIRRANGQRGAAVFSFPKDEILLKKWKEIIFSDAEKIIHSKTRICELHFDEKDIVKFDETILSDGTVHRLPRKRYGLKSKAIPFLDSKRKREDEDCSAEEAIESMQNEMTDSIPEENNLAKKQKVLPMSVPSVCEKSKKTYSVSKEKINFPVDTDVIVDECATKSLGNSEFEEVFIKSKVTEQKHEKSNENNEKLNHDANLSSKGKKINPVVNKIIVFKGNSKIQPKKELLGYSFARLEQDLRYKNLNISSAWAYVLQEVSVTFIYIHPLKLEIQCFCVVDQNLNIKIMTADKRVTKPIAIQINKKKDFVDFLYQLQTTKLCNGTDTEVKYSSDCFGFIMKGDEFSNFKGCIRCKACRDYKKDFMKKNRAAKNRMRYQLSKQNRQIEDLQFKYDELKKLVQDKSNTSPKS